MIPPWEVLPHAVPFVHLDRLLDLDPGVAAKGLRLITADEPSTGGFALLEALYQLAGVAWLGGEARAGAMVAAVRDACLERAVVPGEAVELEARILKVMGGVARAHCAARVGEEVVASAEVTLTREVA